MKRVRTRTLVGLWLGLFLPATAWAETLDVFFSGALHGGIPLGTGGPFTTAETVAGTYSLDLGVADRDSSPTRGFYPGALLDLDVVSSGGIRMRVTGAAAFVRDNAAPYPDNFSTGTIGELTAPPLVLTDRFGNTGTYRLDSVTLSFSAYSSASPHAFLSGDELPGLLPTDWPLASLVLQYYLSSGTPVVTDSGLPLPAPQVSFRILDSVEIPIVAAIDVRPGSTPNALVLGTSGNVPVALLGSESFDVEGVDASSLRFGPDAAMPVHGAGGHVEDVNEDGHPDLLSHYELAEAGFAYGDEEACVTARSSAGLPIRGCDSIRTIPPGCGLGGELSLVLPLLLRLVRRRSGARSLLP
jgi:hypothetical protein